jgi:lycopene elongase/hydratase (dihydrobisanhydrobacterioruberin-forming)
MTNIIKISRPRFWLYLFGPYIVGLAAAASSPSEFSRLDSILFGLYFLLPANLLVYGINDIFDFETDRLNPKKVEYEMLVRPETHRYLAGWILALNLPFMITAYFLAFSALVPLSILVVLSILYSAPPVRAKAIPIVDSLFNVLYVFPAAFAYQMLTGEFPSASVIAAGGLWAAAMHAYSAVPDIEADRAASLHTIATLLGRTGTLAFCFISFIGAATLSYHYLGFLSVALCLSYLSMIVITIMSKQDGHVFTVYRYFPLINAAAGFALFWFVAISNLF